jgi:hypothetical protein
MKLLQLSSSLFISVVFHAYYLNDYIYHHLSLLITVLSLLTHQEKPNEIIRFIDKVVAQSTYMYINIYDTPIIFHNNKIIVIAPLSILVIYIYEFIYPKYSKGLHINHYLTFISPIKIKNDYFLLK